MTASVAWTLFKAELKVILLKVSTPVLTRSTAFLPSTSSRRSRVNRSASKRLDSCETGKAMRETAPKSSRLSWVKSDSMLWFRL